MFSLLNCTICTKLQIVQTEQLWRSDHLSTLLVGRVLFPDSFLSSVLMDRMVRTPRTKSAEETGEAPQNAENVGRLKKINKKKRKKQEDRQCQPL